MQCPSCAAALPEDDLFCEICGVALHPAPACGPSCMCGASAEEVDEDGFCLRCGRRVRRPPSDHIEHELSPAFAAVSDRGLRHDRNEDRFGIFLGEGGYALVICDGVSTSQTSEVASLAVAEGVLAVLSDVLRGHSAEPAENAMLRAIGAGQADLRSRTSWGGSGGNPPSTTVLAALVRDRHVTLGWAGDSRAYWIDAAGAQPLTRDHSWLNEVVSAGQMSVEQAGHSPQAHAITRWLGADSGETSAPEMVELTLPGPGTLLLCTDGLWNYAPSPETIAELVQATPAEGQSALAIADRLVRFANERGGQDNITVVILRLT